MTPLHLAAEAGHVDVVQYLVKDAAADVTAVDKVSLAHVDVSACVCFAVTWENLLRAQKGDLANLQAYNIQTCLYVCDNVSK